MYLGHAKRHFKELLFDLKLILMPYHFPWQLWFWQSKMYRFKKFIFGCWKESLYFRCPWCNHAISIDVRDAAAYKEIEHLKKQIKIRDRIIDAKLLNYRSNDERTFDNEFSVHLG